MEFGEQCSLATCKQLDFLPFVCDRCGHVFCKDHCIPDNHQCSKVSDVLPEDKPPPPSSSEATRFYLCSLGGCKRRELVEVNCQHCSHSFCLLHRHWEDHKCPSIKEKEVRSERRGRLPVSSQRVQESSVGRSTSSGGGQNKQGKKVLKGARSETTSARVALMKLKMKAQGPDFIPQSERVYYEIRLPQEYTTPDRPTPDKPMFFSKEWSLGRVVDYAAEKLKVRNENHKVQAQRLLLRSPDGKPLLPLSKQLHSLSDIIPSGSALTLEYEPKP